MAHEGHHIEQCYWFPVLLVSVAMDGEFPSFTVDCIMGEFSWRDHD